jgi:peptidoglycan/xylan/chitin deacetylase (PgdA/CDA1 family)
MCFRIYIFFLVLIGFNINLKSQKLIVDNSDFFYQIAPIYNFKHGIVSLTFDDGSKNQFNIGIEILKERGIPATFYLITNNIDSATKSVLLKDASPEFEFGSHTVSHSDLVKIGIEEAKKELLNSQSFLQEIFGVNSGLTMSYPWGIYNNTVKQIAKEFYMAARSADPGYNSIYFLNRYAIKEQSFDMHTDALTANQWVNYAVKNHLWLVEMIHGINNVGYSPVDSSVLSEHLDYIKNEEEDIWCSTVSNVIKYIDESTNAKIKCEYCSDTVYNIRINDLMDDSIFNQPLSIMVKVPTNWDKIWVSNGEGIKTEIYNNSKFVLFNALPDNQLLTIRPGSISIPEKETGIRLVFLSANPFFDNIKLTLEVFEQRDIDIALYDMNGRQLINQKEKSVSGVINFILDTSGLNNGLYFLRVSSVGGANIIKKLVKIS